MSHLAPCQSCQRHVRVSDKLCPFCGQELSSEQRNSGPLPLPSRRLGRAGLFAFGATMFGAAACKSGATGSTDAGRDTPAVDGAGGNSGSGGGSGGQGGTGGASNYGGNDGTVDAGSDGGEDDMDAPVDRLSIGSIDAAYGAPAFFDVAAPDTDK